MPVQLLPFQKLVDMPNMAQRYRRAICGLAIASIVLVILILSLLVCAFVGSFAMNVLWNQVLFVFAGIPLVVMVLILVCTSSYISLRNTDKWASTDVCCNLTRSHPTCCTKRCASNKHCCARMSCLHIAASVWTSLFCVLLVALLAAGCNESRRYMYGYRGDRRTLRSSGCLDPSEENVKVGTHVTLIADREAFQKSFDAVPYIWDDAMVSLLGQKVTVVSREGPGIFGLTKSDPRSNQAVWYYPFSVITCVEDKGTTGLQRSSTTATTQIPTTTTETDNESYDYDSYSYYYNFKKFKVPRSTKYDKITTASPWTTTASPWTNNYARHYFNSYTTTKYRYPQQYATTPYLDHYRYRYYRDPATYTYRHFNYYHSSYDTTEETCRTLAWFEAPALVLMICLAITTAVSACLLRAIEKEMPQIEPLPAGKMVVLACPDTVEVPPAPTTEVVRATEVALAPPTEADRVAMGEGNSTTDVKTEQNV